MKKARRLGVAASLATAGMLAATALAPNASAWPWSSTVKVWGTVSSCGTAQNNGWGYYKTGDGEQGWVNFYNGSGSFTFTLNRVPSSGSLVTFKWGVSSCQAARYFVVSRPSYGDSASVGHLG